MDTCRVCGVELTALNKKNGKRPGKICKPCHVKSWRESKRGYYYERNRWHIKVTNTRDSDVTTDYLIELYERTTNCCLCGIELISCPHKSNSKEVDHIIEKSKGGKHYKNNIRIICRKCNIDRNAVRTGHERSPYPGVGKINSGYNRKKPWRAFTRINGKPKLIGTFSTAEEAFEARNKFLSAIEDSKE